MSTRDFPMPPRLVDGAAAWLAGDRTDPVPPRRSATVLLLREPQGGDAPEVFVLRRASGMSFAPDMLAFPGGGVDPRDAEVDLPWHGPGPQEWAARLDVPVEVAREVLCAAAREVFEECGVLLADLVPGGAGSLPTGTERHRERAALVAKEQSFALLLARRGLRLRTDLLQPRGRWVTPECEPRRYDTWFFAARLPDGEQADGRTGEAASAGWRGAAHALRATMLPPTQVMLEWVARHQDVAAALAEPATTHPILPRPVEHDGQLWMRAEAGC